MHRYFIQLSYNGKNYHGWQIQPNAITVQEVLNKKLSVILSEKINLVGAGRTDAGVHSEYFIAHFDSEKSQLHNDDNLIFKINRFLPVDIAVHKIIAVKNEAHARFDAISRTYEYRISTLKEPLLTDFSYYFYGEPDIEAMNQAALRLFDFNDFTSFSKLHTDTKTNNCRILEAKFHYEKKLLIFTITADRFLRNMVRAIVGTLLEVGLHKMKVAEFVRIIESKNRSNAGFSVPPQGLFLTNINY